MARTPIRRFTPEEDRFLVENYPTLGLIECGRRLGRSPGTIQGRRKILGIPNLSKKTRNTLSLKGRGPYTSLEGKHAVHPLQFMNVCTPEVAYLLGLLWADGYVHDQKVTIDCLKADALEYTPTFMSTGEWRFSDRQPLRYGVQGQPMRTIRTGNVLLARYLRSKGYMAKSHQSACQILETIPERLHHYWFRGLVDGDGYLSHNRQRAWLVKITSTYEQDWTYLEALCVRLGIRYRIERNRYTNRHGRVNSRSVFVINTAAGVKQFCEYIYQGREQDGIGLRRKYAKWLEIEAFMRTRPKVGMLFQDAA